jgi:predicted nucleic acid-binding Zn ribbon protein
MPRLTPPEECGNCGAAIPRSARACPECGADERTGWRDASIYDGLDLPGESADEDQAAGRRAQRATGALAWYWIAAFVVVMATLLLGALGLLR